VTIDEVMESLRSVYGYEYRRTAIGYEVLSTKLRTRIFKLNYLNVKRFGESQVRVSSGQVRDDNNNKKNKRTNNTTSSKQNKGQPGVISGSQINTSSVSDFWTNLHKTLEVIIGEEDGRKMVVNAQSGIVVVRAMPDELREVEEYLTAIEAIVQRQVILEAKIIEVQLNESFQTGINWAAFMNGSNVDTGAVGQIGGGSVFDGQGVSGIAGDNIDLGNLSGAEGVLTTAFGGVFTLAIKAGDFAAFIEALENQGDVHVLSSPRVSTVNN
jgi:MSHA biogenesis protein MshL